MNHSDHRAQIEEMIALLEEGGHSHWANWFKQSRNLIDTGKFQASFTKTMSAYGGMGSFNDVFWNLPAEKFERLEKIRGKIWSYARDHRA